MDYVDENFLKSNAPDADKELYLKCNTVAQPYIDKMNADPLSDHHALHAEMSAKIKVIVDEHNLKQTEQSKPK